MAKRLCEQLAALLLAKGLWGPGATPSSSHEAISEHSGPTPAAQRLQPQFVVLLPRQVMVTQQNIQEAEPRWAHALQHPRELGEGWDGTNRCPAPWQSRRAKAIALHLSFCIIRMFQGHRKSFYHKAKWVLHALSTYWCTAGIQMRVGKAIPQHPTYSPTLMILPQTKWISIVGKIHLLWCKTFQTNHKAGTKFPLCRKGLSAESNQKNIQLHFASHGPAHLICSYPPFSKKVNKNWEGLYWEIIPFHSKTIYCSSGIKVTDT